MHLQLRMVDIYMTGFPRYGNNLEEQAENLKKCFGRFSNLFDCVAPGHGHVRDYRALRRSISNEEEVCELKVKDMNDAVDELLQYSGNSVAR